MTTHARKLLFAVIGTAIAATTPVIAAEVTPERLLNADREPQNWLMNHRTYDGQRFSPLDRINKDNVRNLRLAFAVPLGGTTNNENNEATPLAEDGFLYTVDQWGIVYKIDARSGEMGRIVWRMDPGQESVPLANRGVALWGNYVVSVANGPARVIATDKDSGKVVWETNVADQPALQLTGAPLPIKDKIIVGAAGGDSGTRDWIAGFDAKTGKMVWQKYAIPAPGEPGSETWKDKNNAWQTGGAAMYVTGTYDPESNLTIWGTGNPVPMFDPTYRPGDNLYTNSAVAWDADTGKLGWYFQFTPGDMWDFDEEGTHILIDAVINGEPRKLVTHSARNGFTYTLDRNNSQMIGAKPYIEVNWTKGIDPKTGRPVDYDPTKDVQTYAGTANQTPTDRTKKICPSIAGGNNFWPSSYSRRTRMLYIPAMTGCVDVTIDTAKHNKEKGWQGGSYVLSERLESALTVVDPLTQEVKGSAKLAYPNYSGALTTAGGLAFVALTDGTIAAFDDTTLAPLWKVNMGTGFAAPPMTYEHNGKQYVAITSDLSAAARGKMAKTPEMKEQRNATMLYVFTN